MNVLQFEKSINKPCSACGEAIEQDITGEPAIEFKNITLCSGCALDLIEPIYRLQGVGCIQPVIFKELLSSSYLRKKRLQIKNYKKIFNDLLHKYKFACVHCGEKDEQKLTIDHIVPVAKGGTDDYSNLQILCRSCNSAKGTKDQVRGVK